MKEHERQYTSTTAKLLQHLDRLEEMRHGVFRPISVQLAPTDQCTLSCIFCSVKERQMNELSLKQCTDTLVTFRRLGAKTVEITGGGDPTMYPHINELLTNAYALGYKVGMISNGIALKKVSRDKLDRLVWLRISLNSLDYVKDITISIDPNVTLGFSYVWNDKSTPDILEKVKEYADRYHASFVRIVPDCLDVKKMEHFREEISEVINNYRGFFLQEKEYRVPLQCRIGYLKPFVNSDGYIYHCSANPLLNRQFDPRFRICSIDKIVEAWRKAEPFDTSFCEEGKCFFAEHNDLIDTVTMDIPHREFI